MNPAETVSPSTSKEKKEKLLSEKDGLGPEEKMFSALIWFALSCTHSARITDKSEGCNSEI